MFIRLSRVSAAEFRGSVFQSCTAAAGSPSLARCQRHGAATSVNYGTVPRSRPGRSTPRYLFLPHRVCRPPVTTRSCAAASLDRLLLLATSSLAVTGSGRALSRCSFSNLWMREGDATPIFFCYTFSLVCSGSFANMPATHRSY